MINFETFSIVLSNTCGLAISVFVSVLGLILLLLLVLPTVLGVMPTLLQATPVTAG